MRKSNDYFVETEIAARIAMNKLRTERVKIPAIYQYFDTTGYLGIYSSKVGLSFNTGKAEQNIGNELLHCTCCIPGLSNQTGTAEGACGDSVGKVIIYNFLKAETTKPLLNFIKPSFFNFFPNLFSK